jgi:DNA-directed RNA polymerase
MNSNREKFITKDDLSKEKVVEESACVCLVYNPVLFDASCSGIQHIAALTLEKELAKNVNLFTDSDNPENDLPQEFYSYALDLIRSRLKESEINEFQNISLNRKIIKRSVMTIPYNISMSGRGEQLLEHFEKIWEIKQYFIKIPKSATLHKKDIYLSSKEYGQLCKIIYNVLTKELPSLKLLSDYFNNIISLLIELDLPIIWETPIGLKLTYSNIKFKSVRTKAKLLPKTKAVTISLPTDQIDIVKTKRSFMPNFIHSLDAANIHLLLNRFHHLGCLQNKNNYKIPVYTIHDCFASSPNNMNLLEQLVKETFIDIYFKDEGYLDKVHQGILNLINKTKGVLYINGKAYVDCKEQIPIPDLPLSFKNKGMNDFIKGLLKSKYFIG